MTPSKTPAGGWNRRTSPPHSTSGPRTMQKPSCSNAMSSRPIPGKSDSTSTAGFNHLIGWTTLIQYGLECRDDGAIARMVALAFAMKDDGATGELPQALIFGLKFPCRGLSDRVRFVCFNCHYQRQ